MASPRVLVTGASGSIGTALLPSLKAAGYSVTRMVRGTAAGADQIVWDPAQPVAPESVLGFEAVIHLAGESVVGRWSEAKKARIRDSRVLGTRHLSQALAKASQPPTVLVSASATGFYGDRGEETLSENSASGKGFLASVCREWEAATEPAAKAGIRTANIRIGVVLSGTGGALKQMLTPFRLGLGGNIGNGRQWMSWIHVQDLVRAIHHTLKTDRLSGPVNLVSPNPVRNSEFTKTLGAVLVRPTMFPMPAFVARTVFGQMADELLLASQRVEPAKLAASGYSFQFQDLRSALDEILKRPSK